MPTYATGKYAYGTCDRCGFRCDYTELKMQRRDHKPSGLYVCPECLDKERPRDRGAKPDAIALRHPRPDGSLAASRRILHWWPVDSFRLPLRLGEVTIYTPGVLPPRS